MVCKVEIEQGIGQGAIKNIVAVMSAKGGTGKTLVTALLAVGLRYHGLQVGILDGDLNSSGIAQLFGMQDMRIPLELARLEAPSSEGGIKIMAMSMFMGNEPVVWRETMIASACKQFYRNVYWGGLDYLLVDAPCGTSDVPMAILEALPLKGVLIVATPQQGANISVKKCVTMVRRYKRVPLGIVENMTHYISPVGRPCELASSSVDGGLANRADLPLLAQLPLDCELVNLCDAGRIESCRPELYQSLVTRFLAQMALIGE